MAPACADLCARKRCNNRCCTAGPDEHTCSESQRNRNDESRDFRGRGLRCRTVCGKGGRLISFVVSAVPTGFPSAASILSCIPSDCFRHLALQLPPVAQRVRFAGGFWQRFHARSLQGASGLPHSRASVPRADGRRVPGNRVPLAALISPAEVRPSLESQPQGGPPLFRPGSKVATSPLTKSREKLN
jgi:hypothetical protein